MTFDADTPAVTLTAMMARRAAADPDKPYFHLYGNTVTYGRLWAQSLRYASGLARAGVGAGDKVCLVYPTCEEFFYTFFGALHLGAVPVPLYPTLGIEGTASILNDAEAVAIATIGWFRAEVEKSAGLSPRVKAIVEPPDLDVGEALPPLPTARAEDVAFIQYTSGSTADPRGVVLSHANVVETIKFMAEAARLTAEDRVVSWLPLYHDMGLIGCAFTPPLTGTPLWLLPPDLRNPRQWLELITEVKGTFTVAPDFGYRNCVRNIRDTAGIDLRTLRGALSGAEPVRPSTIEAFEKKFGLRNVVNPCYGLAEATLAVSIWPRDTPVRLDATGRFVSVGWPCPGVSVQIRPPRGEAGADEIALPANTEGEVCVKSPGVMLGYYRNPAATARVLGPDGWLRTDDLGFLDGDGALFITGRLKDLIVLAGENLVPADIEEVVDHVDGVRYSAAVGVDSERTGTQRLHVVAEIRDQAAGADAFPQLVREIVTRLHRARGHRPARVVLVRPGTIPKTSSGKIQRSRLAAMIHEGSLHDQILHTSGGGRV
jgi:acyl-CoA synthetase (AMP-forming)/AMP-acid ligase II